jgi:hypothetical protein
MSGLLTEILNEKHANRKQSLRNLEGRDILPIETERRAHSNELNSITKHYLVLLGR